MILLLPLRRLTEIKKEGPKANLLYEDLSDGKIGNNQIGTLEKFFKYASTARTPQESGGLLPAPPVLAGEGVRVGGWHTTHHPHHFIPR